MQEKMITFLLHFGGTLAANQTICWTMPCAATLLEVSASGSNTNDATLKVGTTSDDDAYLVAFAIGDGNVPVVKAGADQVDGQAMQIANNTVMLLTLDYDGASGTAAANVTILVTMLTG